MAAGVGAIVLGFIGDLMIQQDFNQRIIFSFYKFKKSGI